MPAQRRASRSERSAAGARHLPEPRLKTATPVVASAFTALQVRVCVASNRKQRRPEAGIAVANAALIDRE